MNDISLKWCTEQDIADPLKQYRNRFDLPEGIIYMDGNSLGPLPIGVSDRVARVVSEEWRSNLVKSWNSADWINLPTRVGAKIAPLIGAKPHEVVMADSTSVNLFKVAAAALKMRPGRCEILSEPGNFPTDLYMMQGLAAFLGNDCHLKTVDRADIAAAITQDTAIVLLTQVHYVSADMMDMKAITRAAHDKGALIIWDLSHSAGAVPVVLNESNADFAVGCGYKYLNGGPGAPAFIFVAERHLKSVQQPLTGWFGHSDPFGFVDDYLPSDGIKRMLVGTPGILAASALDSALDAFNGVDMALVRHKSVALTDLFIRLVESRLVGYGVELATPKDSARRGSHVSLTHENAFAVMQALIERGVIGDFRAPNFLRFGMTPLYLGFEDMYRAVDTLADILNTEQWHEERFSKKSAVT